VVDGVDDVVGSAMTIFNAVVDTVDH